MNAMSVPAREGVSRSVLMRRDGRRGRLFVQRRAERGRRQRRLGARANDDGGSSGTAGATVDRLGQGHGSGEPLQRGTVVLGGTTEVEVGWARAVRPAAGVLRARSEGWTRRLDQAGGRPGGRGDRAAGGAAGDGG